MTQAEWMGTFTCATCEETFLLGNIVQRGLLPKQDLDDSQVWVDTNGPDNMETREGETFTTNEF